MEQQKKKAVILFSGGLDSTTVLALARAEGYSVHALSFRYGQRHMQELAAATKIAHLMGVEKHLVIDINMRDIGGSALTDDIEVPKIDQPGHEEGEIPVTYVPARNTIFLSFALGWAEVLGSDSIFIGVNAIDYSGYPDCRPEFISAFEKMANLATKAGIEGTTRIRIKTPLLHMSKADIIRKGMELGVDYGMTHSCYDPSREGYACGRCDSCILRKQGFARAGVPDPTRYR
ncbi:7-cyano-7-deazaguanine synthase QueC [Desulfolithobacter sp.]